MHVVPLGGAIGLTFIGHCNIVRLGGGTGGGAALVPAAFVFLGEAPGTYFLEDGLIPSTGPAENIQPLVRNPNQGPSARQANALTPYTTVASLQS